MTSINPRPKKYPNSPSVGVSPKLAAALEGFYRLAHIYSETCDEDPGNLMGHAVASCWDGRYSCDSKKMTCYVLPGLQQKNYYLLFTAEQDRDKQEKDIMEQLQSVSAKAADRGLTRFNP